MKQPLEIDTKSVLIKVCGVCIAAFPIHHAINRNIPRHRMTCA